MLLPSARFRFSTRCAQAIAWLHAVENKRLHAVEWVRRLLGGISGVYVGDLLGCSGFLWCNCFGASFGTVEAKLHAVEC